MELGLTQSLKQEQTLSPQMLQSLALLPMPILELKEHIQKEIEANPALEIPGQEFSEPTLQQSEPSNYDDNSDDADSSFMKTMKVTMLQQIAIILQMQKMLQIEQIKCWKTQPQIIKLLKSTY